jgi:ankyrin repeat protein
MWGGEPQPLHVAIERNHSELFAFLLENGADVDGKDATYDGWSPLMLALHHRREDMRDQLLARGAKIGLPEALLLGDDARVEKILTENPALVREPMPSLASPIGFARTLPALRLLVELGAPLGQRNRYGASPVESIATAGGQYRPLVEFLVQAKAPAPAWIYASMGMLPQLRAIARQDLKAVQTARIATAAIEAGHANVVAWLLRSGLSPDTRAEDGAKATLLHAAAWNGNLEIAKMLVESGANPNEVDAEYRTTPLVWAQTALERLGRENCRAVRQYLEGCA